MIADSKFGKYRLVFLHPSAIAELRAYARARPRLHDLRHVFAVARRCWTGTTTAGTCRPGSRPWAAGGSNEPVGAAAQHKAGSSLKFHDPRDTLRMIG